MITGLPATLAPFVPHARPVLLRHYTSLSAVVVPNLGLRLLFPKSVSADFAFALTNPLFVATRLGPHGLLLTVARGSHRRYCGNVFMSLGSYSVSLLLCTSNDAVHYASDIVFAAPPAKRGPRLTPSKGRPPLWRRMVADIAYGQNHTADIRKRVRLVRGSQSRVLYVRRFVFTAHHAVLGFVLARPQTKAPQVRAASLFVGRAKWWPVLSHMACRANKNRHKTRCALVLRRPQALVRRWHLVVLTSLGAARISW